MIMMFMEMIRMIVIIMFVVLGGDGMGVMTMGSDYNDFMMMVFFRNSKGVNWTLWPLGLVAYWRRTSTFDPGEYHVSY